MANTIDHYISNLLYYHECVVVPDFGAFLTRYFPAEINPATHMMRPPSKRVVFNARIQENDGLLAKHIANETGVSYQKALESIEISARSWKKVLRAGKKVNLIGIGRLYMDDKGKLQFNPAHDINYDIHSYGLNIFRASAIERDQEIIRSVNKAIEKHTQKKTATGKQVAGKSPEKEKTKKTPWVRWVATFGPVAALLIVGAYVINRNPETVDKLSGAVSSVLSPESTDSVTAKEEAGISFDEAPKVTLKYGPEADVISEDATPSSHQEEKLLKEPTKEKQIEEEALTADPRPLEKQDNAVAAINTKETTTADSKNSSLADDFPDIDKFDLDRWEEIKPLYNVKPRPGEDMSSVFYKRYPQMIYQDQQSAQQLVAAEPVQDETVEESYIQPSASHSPRQSFNQASSEVPANQESKAVKEVSSSPTAVRPKGSFQIVVGAFSQTNNAQRYVAEVQAKGFEAYISGHHNGLHRVAIGSFGNREQATQALAQIKKQVNFNAWVNRL